MVGDMIQSIISYSEGDSIDIFPSRTFNFTKRGLLSRLSTIQSHGFEFTVIAFINMSLVYITSKSNQPTFEN